MAKGGVIDESVGTADAEPVPLEVLERRLTGHAARLAAHEARWLGWLAEYDERQGWAEWGCISAAHWLSWTCGMTGSAAHERVRVARALPGLPLIEARFCEGRLSWSKVRALTRVANADNEAELVELAVHATGAQLERICRAMRSVIRNQDAPMPFDVRGWTKRRMYDGTTLYTLRVTDDASEAIDAQLEREVTELLDDAVGEAGESASRRAAISERGGIEAVRSDAAVALLTGASGLGPVVAPVQLIVDADAHADHVAEARPIAATHVPAEPPAPATTHVPAETPAPAVALVNGTHVDGDVGRRLCCDPRVTPLLESALQSSVSVGRSGRFIPAAMRLALERRDRHACRFPGCSATRRLHAHHIIHWIDGGETELANLILLCHFHHHLVHEGGWRVDPGTRRFVSPDGRRVEPNPDLERFAAGLDLIEPDLATLCPDVNALRPPTYDRLDLGWTIGIILDNEERARRERAGPDRAEP